VDRGVFFLIHFGLLPKNKRGGDSESGQVCLPRCLVWGGGKGGKKIMGGSEASPQGSSTIPNLGTIDQKRGERKFRVTRIKRIKGKYALGLEGDALSR